MRAGKLRYRVLLQKLPDPPTGDGHGDPQEREQDWQDVATLWGNLEPLTGREFFSSDVRIGEVTHVVRIRHRAGIVPKMRLKMRGRVFQIEAVVNVNERDRELELYAFERV